jgi:hypothetical protein
MLVRVTAAFVLVLAAVLAFNWKYLYNWAAGPVHFDAQIAAAPGAHEFVRVEGTLMPSRLVQESTLRRVRFFGPRGGRPIGAVA